MFPFGISQVQIQQRSTTHVYTSQLQEQFTWIEREVDRGERVTVTLQDGDLQTTLAFADGRVADMTDAPVPDRTPHEFTLADNQTLRAYTTHTYVFDLQHANAHIDGAEMRRAIFVAADLRVADAAIRERLAAGLPLAAISQLGNDEYFLVDDCSYRANDGYTITACKGFKTDLASIPRLLLPFVSVRDLSITPPTFHDLIYRSAGHLTPPLGHVVPDGKRFARAEADDLFLELMTREKVAYFKRNLAYAAVRLGGRSAWRDR